MKCPKCGYLGFESGDRCRNCGYDFSLAPPTPSALDLALDREIEQPRPPLDLDRIIGDADLTSPDADLPLFGSPPAETTGAAVPTAAEPEAGYGSSRTSAVARGARSEDAPLITVPARPRAPLGVRRATPEVPRARARPSKPAPAHEDALFETPPLAVIGQKFDPRHGTRSSEPSAAPLSRIMAAVVDAFLLSSLDAVVLYFTLRLCGLTALQTTELPLLPLMAFFLLLNGGYFVAFTVVGGQSIGKMALGIRVITQEEESVPVGRATLRTLAYLLSALPLGAGFLVGVLSADRLALHDRLAHTRVIRPS
jgi:uncharacterized RDD family membrane protein YckC